MGVDLDLGPLRLGCSSHLGEVKEEERRLERSKPWELAQESEDRSQVPFDANYFLASAQLQPFNGSHSSIFLVGFYLSSSYFSTVHHL